MFLSGGVVYKISRCPQCGVANPLISTVCKPKLHYKNGDINYFHFTAQCSKCNRHTLFYGYAGSGQISVNNETSEVQIQQTYPTTKEADEHLPDRARTFLQQALESLHAPDGALMLAASSVGAMLKEKGYRKGSLYERINQARTDGLFTEQMESWAHEIRLNANEPRHADDDFAGATQEDATQVIEFAEALGEYLFVLPERVKKWSIAAGRRA